MARYIDADALLENLKKQYGEELGWQCTVNMSDVGMMIEDAPTADVVPKREVDKTIAEWAYLHADTLNKLENSKAEVAREIFAEIENLFAVENFRLICNRQDFAELKKKYTEGH